MKVIHGVVLSACLLSGCATRSLTDGEAQLIEQQMDGVYDSSSTEISSKSVTESQDFKDAFQQLNSGGASLPSFNAVPFVINNTIYYPEAIYRDDFSDVVDDPIDYLDWGLFAHETCHVFQYQQGLTSEKHDGQPYTWRLGLKEQLFDPGRADAYTVNPSDITSTSKLKDFYFEQQCVIFERWARDPNNPDTQIYGDLFKKALVDLEAGSDSTLPSLPSEPRQNTSLFEGKWTVDSQNPIAVIVAKTKPVNTLDKPMLFKLDSVRLGLVDGKYEVLVDGKALKAPLIEGSSVLVWVKETLAIKYLMGNKHSGSWSAFGDTGNALTFSNSFPPANTASHASILGQFDEDRLMVVRFDNALGEEVDCDVAYGRVKIDSKAVQHDKRDVLYRAGNAVLVRGSEAGAFTEFTNCRKPFEPVFSLQINN
tara:strand:+ start:882 stop:2153 length:1272 start_codon:yes stop_codon:yes gene_type:complete